MAAYLAVGGLHGNFDDFPGAERRRSWLLTP